MPEDGTEQKVIRRCTNCGDEWEAKIHALSSGYDCFGCGAPGGQVETVREVDTDTDRQERDSQ